MRVIETELKGVFIIEPQVFTDERGYFFESFSQRDFAAGVCDTVFVQDNESHSRRGVIRALHYQLPPFAQGKLVRVVSGRILDVAVDIRAGSPTLGKHVAVELSSDNHHQLFIPRGFAHGFSVLSDQATVCYKGDNYYRPGSERSIIYNDARLAIDWKVPPGEETVSEKDRRGVGFDEAQIFEGDFPDVNNNLRRQ